MKVDVKSAYTNLRRTTSVWTLLAGATFLVQLYRWSIADMWIFGVATLLLFAESSGLLNKWKFNGFLFNEFFLMSFVMVSVVFIYLTPRQDPKLAAYFIFITAPILISLWNSSYRHERLNKREFKSAIFWSCTFITIGLWELAALVLSRIAHNSSAYPTISELLVPTLDEPFSRLQFLILWLGIGHYFVSKWSKK